MNVFDPMRPQIGTSSSSKKTDVGPDERSIYLDANATVPPLNEVIAAVVDAMRSTAGNPASAHSAGSRARRLLEIARDRVCTLIKGAESDDVIFVSGGTEANNTVIESFAADECVTFIAAPVEHASVLEPLRRRRSDRVAWVKVDSSGCIDPDDAGRKAETIVGRPVLIVQAANSETGVIQPLVDVVRSVRRTRPDAFVHLDAAQGVGRVILDLATLPVNSVSFSGHKLHGPLGTGVLVVRNADESDLRPLILGGGQERGWRSGTPNVPGISGLGIAAKIRTDSFLAANHHMSKLRKLFEDFIIERLEGSAAINGGSAPRVSNTSNLRFRSVDGMQMLARLDKAGECSSCRSEPG
jgi:cysteine desulfurase